MVSFVAYGRDLKLGKVLPQRGLHDVVGGGRELAEKECRYLHLRIRYLLMRPWRFQFGISV